MKHALSLLPALVVASCASAQSAIYLENFGATVNGNTLNNVGWTVHTNSGGTGAVLRVGDSGGTALSNSTGSPTGVANVNAGSSLSDSTGFVFSFAQNPASYTNPGAGSASTILSGNNAALFWTNEYTIDRSAFTVTSISVTMRNSATTNRARLAVQIGGAWYATDTAFTTSTGGSAGTFATESELKTFAFTTDAAAWRTLNFDGGFSANGTQLSVVGATLGSALPAGDITAFGVFVDATNTTGGANGGVRFDTFTINATAVPEPSAFAALAGLAGLGLVVTRRRRP